MSKLRFQTVEEMAKEVAEKALNEYVFEGKTIRQWVEIILRDHDAHRWIPCGERFPDDADDRFYMCVVENHEEDPPMFCQYEEEYGFGFWRNIFDPVSLGFVDSEFQTNEELGYEKVIAWMQLPESHDPADEELRQEE